MGWTSSFLEIMETSLEDTLDMRYCLRNYTGRQKKRTDYESVCLIYSRLITFKFKVFEIIKVSCSGKFTYDRITVA